MKTDAIAVANAFKAATNAQQSEAIGVQFIGDGGAEFYKINSKSSDWFCKRLPVNKFPQLLRHEAEGLTVLRTAGLPVPEKAVAHCTDDHQYLFTSFHSNKTPVTSYWESAGIALAKLHQKTGSHFGWTNDNYIGLLPQRNDLMSEWISFFRDYRLQALVQQCTNEGLLPLTDVDRFHKLYHRLDDFFESDVKPVLVHGDLWRGNLIVHNHGGPLFIDPSVYYGHPAMDLAMTKLFGGFANNFYTAYQHAGGVVPCTETIAVCNLYPLLVHLKLFGRPYLGQIQQTLQRIT